MSIIFSFVCLYSLLSRVQLSAEVHKPLYMTCLSSIKSLFYGMYNCSAAQNIWPLWQVVNFCHRTVVFCLFYFLSFFPRLSLGSKKPTFGKFTDLILSVSISTWNINRIFYTVREYDFFSYFHLFFLLPQFSHCHRELTFRKFIV